MGNISRRQVRKRLQSIIASNFEIKEKLDSPNFHITLKDFQKKVCRDIGFLAKIIADIEKLTGSVDEEIGLCLQDMKKPESKP